MSQPSVSWHKINTRPSTILRSFELVPESVHAALLLRHGHRAPIKPGTSGAEVPLTARGTRTAEVLGAVLGRRQPGRLLSSPVGRCVDTARALARGAGWNQEIVQDWRLGDPGPFVVDGSLAGPMFLELGVEVIRRQLVELKPPPGMRQTSEGVSLIANLIMEGPQDPDALDVLVTHDAIIAVVIGHILGVVPDAATWPAFLDGAFVWSLSGQLGIAWAGSLYTTPLAPQLPGLSEEFKMPLLDGCPDEVVGPAL